MSKKRASPSNGNGSRFSLSPGAWLGIALTVSLHIAHMAFTSGVVMTRVAYIEKGQDDHKRKLEDFSALTAKMAAVEAQLVSINSTLGRLERTFGRDNGK